HVALDQCAFGENRQLAMRYEWRDAHDRVVTPVRAAIALPPGAADGVGAHAKPHTELENAGKRARRGHADYQALQNPETGIDLHDAHELEDQFDAHGAVGIEHDCEVVTFAPARAEVADVAGLERDILAATSV